MVQAWRRLSPRIEATSPKNANDVLNTSLWWTTRYVGVNFGFPPTRARVLAHKGLLSLRDLWEPHSMTPRPWPTLQRSYGLLDGERPLIDQYLAAVPREWADLYATTQGLAQPFDWLGVFVDELHVDPVLLLQATKEFCPCIS